MTPENEAKKNYLSRYRWSVLKLSEIEKEITHCRLGALPGSPVYDGMPHGSGGESDLSDYAVKLDELIMEFKAVRERALKETRQITQAIEAIEDPCSNILLRYRYIQLKTWAQIGDAMGYSEVHVKRLHGIALNHFDIPEDDTK